MLFLILFVSVAFITAFALYTFLPLITDFLDDYFDEEPNYLITMDWDEED